MNIKIIEKLLNNRLYNFFCEIDIKNIQFNWKNFNDLLIGEFTGNDFVFKSYLNEFDEGEKNLVIISIVYPQELIGKGNFRKLMDILCIEFNDMIDALIFDNPMRGMINKVVYMGGYECIEEDDVRILCKQYKKKNERV